MPEHRIPRAELWCFGGLQSYSDPSISGLVLETRHFHWQPPKLTFFPNCRCLWKPNFIKWKKRWADCGGFLLIALQLNTSWRSEGVKLNCVLVLQKNAGNKQMGSDCDFLKNWLSNFVQFSKGEAKVNYFDQSTQPDEQKGKHLQSWRAFKLKCPLRKECFSL